MGQGSTLLGYGPARGGAVHERHGCPQGRRLRHVMQCHNIQGPFVFSTNPDAYHTSAPLTHMSCSYNLLRLIGAMASHESLRAQWTTAPCDATTFALRNWRLRGSPSLLDDVVQQHFFVRTSRYR